MNLFIKLNGDVTIKQLSNLKKSIENIGLVVTISDFSDFNTFIVTPEIEIKIQDLIDLIDGKGTLFVGGDIITNILSRKQKE